MNFTEDFLEVIKTDSICFAQLRVTVCHDVVEFLLRQIVFISLFELIFEALPDLHKSHFVSGRKATLLCFFAHITESFNETLGSQLFLEELPPFLTELCLLQSQQVMVSQVHSEPPLKHQKSFDMKVLHDFLSRVIEKLQLHLERFFQRFPKSLPKFRAYSRLQTYALYFFTCSIRRL